MGSQVSHTIALDWGSSSLRCYLLDAQGTVLDKKSSADGILQRQDFAQVLLENVGAWRTQHPHASLIASGMIGSRQGWCEAVYLPCPVDLAELSTQLTQVETPLGPLHIVPGLNCTSPQGLPDVMRGEETQIVGALNSSHTAQTFVLPGTHSKWAHVAHGKLLHFASYMSGEVFALLSQHSILAKLAAPSASFKHQAFERGVLLSLHASADFLHHIFSARSAVLQTQLAADEVVDYVSGLVLGNEIMSARGHFGTSAVILIGGAQLCQRYQLALQLAGIQAHLADENCVVHGLHSIAQQIVKA